MKIYIKFIKKITDYVEKDYPKQIVGNCIYYDLTNGKVMKLWCYEYGVKAEIINKFDGKVDSIDIPFSNYFEPTQCSSGAPKWTQHIDNGKWYFENTYKHVLPTEKDYIKLAMAIEMYIKIYE